MKASTGWLARTGSPFNTAGERTGCAHLSHYTVNYGEWGEGPPLVLVPGLAGGYGLLEPLARLLSRSYRVIGFQLRGEDDCFALRRRFDMGDLVEDLTEFLDWHRLESPAVLGVSFGAALALEFAATRPARLSKLIVQGVGVGPERSLLRSVAGSVLTRYPLPADNPFINQFFNLLFGGKQKPGPLFDFVTRRCWQTDQGVMAHRFRVVEQFDMTDRAGRVRVPTLLMAGDRDLLVSEKNLRALWTRLPDAELVRLPRAGHLAFLTHTDRVAGEALRFLQREVAEVAPGR